MFYKKILGKSTKSHFSCNFLPLRSTILTALKFPLRQLSLEDHGAKTVLGLVTRIIAKVVAYTFRKYLLRFHSIDVLTFQTVKIS